MLPEIRDTLFGKVSSAWLIFATCELTLSIFRVLPERESTSKPFLYGLHLHQMLTLSACSSITDLPDQKLFVLGGLVEGGVVFVILQSQISVFDHSRDCRCRWYYSRTLQYL